MTSNGTKLSKRRRNVMFKRIVCVILCVITVLLSGCGIEYNGERKNMKKFKSIIDEIKKETKSISYIGVI